MHTVASFIGTGRNVLVSLLQHTRNDRRKRSSKANLPHPCTGAVAAVATAAGAAAAESAAESAAAVTAAATAEPAAARAVATRAVAATAESTAAESVAASFDAAGLRVEIRHGRTLQWKLRPKGVVQLLQQQSGGLS